MWVCFFCDYVILCKLKCEYVYVSVNEFVVGVISWVCSCEWINVIMFMWVSDFRVCLWEWENVWDCIRVC